MAGVQEQAAQNTATVNATARQVSLLQQYVAESERRYEQAIEKLMSRTTEQSQRITRLERLAQALRVARQAADEAFAQIAGEPGPRLPEAPDTALVSAPAAAGPSAPAVSPDERVGQLMQRIAEAERHIDNVDAWLTGAIHRGDAQAAALQNLQNTTSRARRLARKAFERATRAHHRVSNLAEDVAGLQAASDRMTQAQQSMLARVGVLGQSATHARHTANEAMKEAVRTAGRSKRIGAEIDKVVRQIEQVSPAGRTPTRSDRLGQAARLDTNARLRRILERSQAAVGGLRNTPEAPTPYASASVNTSAGEALARDLTHLADVLNA